MSARKKQGIDLIVSCLRSCLLTSLFLFTSPAIAATKPYTLTADSLANELGWVENSSYQCGGYYEEPPFIYPFKVENDTLVETTGNQGLFSFHGTSVIEGKVTINRQGQQITANKAFLYRDPNTSKLTAIDLLGDVHLREPNTLIVAKKGRYDFVTKTKSLYDILYRTSLNERKIVGPTVVSNQERKQARIINTMTAWGKAFDFSSSQPKIYELTNASFTTCPPVNPAWRVKASRIVLNKNTGRGYATHAQIMVKNIPVFYMPYINFSIDHQRKSGFLWPIIGVNNKFGPYFLAPFYWNMAPNYDMTITPGYLSKRGLQLSDEFRYLTPLSSGKFDLSVLPDDRFFEQFQEKIATDPVYSKSTNTMIQSEFNRLQNDSLTRKGLFWSDKSRFDDHWSSDITFNYAGDDYYLRDFGRSISEISQNQLLQQGNLYYKGENWNFIGRMQAYQTMHPIDEPQVANQYRRFPQLILNGDYPDQPLGLEYFVSTDMTHFDILNTPGTPANQPIGNRINLQPGVNLPIYTPYLFINPRVQVSLTDYNLYQTADTNAPTSVHRAIPIYDIAAGLSFVNDITLFNHDYHQTLEPQAYYTFIPYHNQSEIPVFDTTYNTLVYDQLFNYNRFSGLDRIGDANQVGVGVSTRLIDDDSGLEKVRLGVGEIVYFANRLVTLCTGETCATTRKNHSDYQRLSPLTGLLNYNVNPSWSFAANTIWNPVSKQMDNASLSLHYSPVAQHIINLGYSYARGGDPLSGVVATSPMNNLKVTDLSVAWPIVHDVSAVGRWSQNWNHAHLQNMIYGLQYDTCCWAVRMVAERAFIGIDPNNNNQLSYTNNFYIQFALKGLGNIGSENTGKMLSSIAGYDTHFGQEF